MTVRAVPLSRLLPSAARPSRTRRDYLREERLHEQGMPDTDALSEPPLIPKRARRMAQGVPHTAWRRSCVEREI
jgi:hypothetical protein